MLTKNRKKLIKSLHQKKYRELHGLFLVEGEKMIQELLQSVDEGSGFEIEDLLVTEKLHTKFTSSVLISEMEMKSLTGFKTAPGVLAVVKMPSPVQTDLSQLKNILVLDDIQDPGNLGTIMRSAEWFGVEHVFLSENTVDIYNPKSVQSTMGSLFRINCSRISLPSLYELLTQNDIVSYAAHMEGGNVKTTSWAQKKALVVGNEANGLSSISKSRCNRTVSILGSGKAESLNAAIAASIILSHW